MSNKTTTGSCLCGKIRYRFEAPIKIFQYCHCSRCRKFTGSAHASSIIVDPSNFEWLSGEEYLGRYELPEAKHYATTFCKNCGSSLPWLAQSGKTVVIPAGTLDEDPEARPEQNVYYADRAPWYEESGNLKKYDALPVK